MSDLFRAGAAEFDSTGRYRYVLRRSWEGGGEARVCWIMLNPSTADADHDDATIRRCISFTRAAGGGRMSVVNLFAWRATNPDVLREVTDPIGPDNDTTILCEARASDLVIAAWGSHAWTRRRAGAVWALLADMGIRLHALATTADGSPRHPLYLPATERPQPWSGWAPSVTHRRTRPRARVLAPRTATADERRRWELAAMESDAGIRPRTRADCENLPRPCPFVSCKHHLYLDVSPETGSIKLNFPDLEVEDMRETCALDVADRGGVTLEEVGELLNLTRERVRQLEVAALLQLKDRHAAEI